jgi:DNA replication protein DnaC
MNSLEFKLSQLHLSRIREVYAAWAQRAAQTEMSYTQFLEELISEEVLLRQENQLRRRLKLAGFPYEATLEQFDWSLRPELKRQVILRYAEPSFVEKAGSLLLIGPSGTGKTHLAVALGLASVQQGYEVRFITAQKLANGVLAATSRLEVSKLLAPLIKCRLLILDELGYLPLDPKLGPVLYELISSRYERWATIVTSNKSLSSWGEVVGGSDTSLIMAILDRLLHHGEVFYLRGSSYRTRGKEVLTLLPPVGSEVESPNGVKKALKE